MSERLGMADGRCFTVHAASTILNTNLTASNGIAPQDNYSYRQLLQKAGPALMEPFVSKDKCMHCNNPK